MHRFSTRIADDLQRGALLCAAYVLTGTYGLELAAVSGFAAPVWAPTGIAIAAVILFGYRMWPAIALGAFLTNLAAGAPVAAAVGIAAGNSLEALAALFLLRHISGFNRALPHLRDVVTYIVVAPLFSTTVSASIGVISLWLAGTVSSTAAVGTWITWWVGDVLGALTVTPFLLAWFGPEPGSRRAARPQPANLLAWPLLAAVCIGVFGGYIAGITGGDSLTYLLFPALTWFALAFSPRGVTTALLVTAAAGIAGTALGRGPFAIDALAKNLLFLEIFFGTVASTMLILSAAVRERNQALAAAKQSQEDLKGEVEDRKKLERQLEEYAQHLEGRVRERTEKLQRAFEETNQSERRFRAVFDAAEVGIVISDLDGRIIQVNPAYASMLGYAPTELVMKHDIEYTHPDDRERSIALFKETLAGKRTRFSLEKCYLRKDGKIVWGLATGTLVRQDNGEPQLFVGMVLDETTKKKAEASVAELNELRNKFIQIVSHQLRTPLNAIRWNLEMLLVGDVGVLKKNQREFIRLTHDANIKVIERIQDLLTAMDIEEGRVSLEVEELPLESMGESVFAQMKKRCTVKDVSCLYEPPVAPLPTVRGDGTKLREVLEKLLENAIAYTPAGGHIKVTLGRVGDPIRFTVEDTGIGIPRHEQSHVFTRFFRASNAATMLSDASGLSLSIAKFFVEQHGGRIGFTSEEGKGSTFWFEVPVS